MSMRSNAGEQTVFPSNEVRPVGLVSYVRELSGRWGEIR